MKYLVALLFALNLTGTSKVQAEQTFKLYIDADFSHNLESSQAIERGIQLALQEVNEQINGIKIETVRKDHRGNSARSKKHLHQYTNDPTALAVFAGLHSPPLLANRDYINQNAVLVLDPWAAAGPITRPAGPENWIFRLSIDDLKAGEVIVSYATGKHAVKKPCLILENTGWGNSNLKTMTAALFARGLKAADVQRFNWGLKSARAAELVANCLNREADSLFLVANTSEGYHLIKAALHASTDKSLPVFSHWGITGGRFQDMVSSGQLHALELYFIQTRFSFLKPQLNALQRKVLKNAIDTYPDYTRAQDISAPTGLIHAYDLTRLFIRAAQTMRHTMTISEKRLALRNALENLDQPVQGLIKKYRKPFSIYSTDSKDAHEALDIFDYAMASFSPEKYIVLDNWQYSKADYAE